MLRTRCRSIPRSRSRETDNAANAVEGEAGVSRTGDRHPRDLLGPVAQNVLGPQWRAVRQHERLSAKLDASLWQGVRERRAKVVDGTDTAVEELALPKAAEPCPAFSARRPDRDDVAV